MASRDINLSSEDFGLKMYNRFPPQYREDDIKEKYALKRYLEACADGGMKYTIDEWNGILNIPNVDLCDPKFLPALCRQYGFDWFNGIPETYLRYFIPRLNEAWSKKGSLDVVEYVVSTLSGIKTTTDVHPDQYGNPHIDIILEMDYNIGDYFPDAVQFKDIIDNFLPFYLNSTLIYSYVFYEKQRIWLAESEFFDHVKYVTQEYGMIPLGQGIRPSLLLNIPDRKLNNNFILNDGTTYIVDPDYHFEAVHSSYAVSSQIHGEETDLLGVKLAPVHDESNLRGETERFEAVKIEDTFRFYATLNTDLVLNVDLYTNRGAQEYCELNLAEEFRVDACSLKPYDTQADLYQNNGNDMFQGLFTNVVEATLNEGYILIPDCFDVIFNPNVGTYVTFPSLHKYVGA